MKKNRYSHLFSNVYLFSIGEFGTKIILFILIPIYTSIMTTSEYGIADIVISTITLIIPLLTIASSDVILRYSLDNEIDKNILIKIVLKRIIYSTIIMGIPAFFVLRYYQLQSNYIIIMLIYLFTAIRKDLLQFSRGIDKTKEYAITSIVTTILLLIFNLVFLCVLKLGITGYLLSVALSEFIGSAFIFIFAKIYLYIRLDIDKQKEKELKKDTIKYGLPLVPNKIFWWITNLSDRYMIIYMISSSMSGIYTAASKLPNIFNVFVNVFMQAWTVSAVQEREAEDKSKFYSQIFNYFQLFSMIVGSFVLLNIKVIGQLLYKREFYESINVVPIILLGVIYNSFSAFFGSILVAYKKTGIIFKTTMYGAIFNIICNIFAIKICGIYGAAISTLISYIIILIMRYFTIQKTVKLKIAFKPMIYGTLILIMQFILVFFNLKNYYIFSLILWILYIVLNYKEIKYVTNITISRILKKINKV